MVSIFLEMNKHANSKSWKPPGFFLLFVLLLKKQRHLVAATEIADTLPSPPREQRASRALWNSAGNPTVHACLHSGQQRPLQCSPFAARCGGESAPLFFTSGRPREARGSATRKQEVTQCLLKRWETFSFLPYALFWGLTGRCDRFLFFLWCDLTQWDTIHLLIAHRSQESQVVFDSPPDC